MAPFAIQANDNSVTGIAKAEFIKNLLLFEHLLIPTVWLDDMRILARHCDINDLNELLETGALSFHLESVTTGETGQLDFLHRADGKPKLLPNEFEISILKGRNDNERKKQKLDALASAPELPKADREALASSIESRFVEPQEFLLHSEAHKLAIAKLADEGSDLLSGILTQRFQRLTKEELLVSASFSIIGEGQFRIDTNLPKHGIASSVERRFVMAALLDVFGIFTRLKQMEKYSCITAINEQDAMAWRQTGNALIRSFVKAGDHSEQMGRVLRVAGLGEGQLISNGQIDLRRLMQLRASDEIHAFRRWLAGIDDLTDAEIQARLSNLRGKIGNASKQGIYKAIRFLFTSLAPSLIPDAYSLAGGTALSAADTYLFERLFPSDAVSAVIGNHYPAIMGARR